MLRQLAGFFRENAPGSSNTLRGEEFKLPRMSALITVITYNMFLQVSAFMIIPSLSKYAEYLGGGTTFYGVILGIPLLFSGIALIPMTKYDKGRYTAALHVGSFAGILANVTYAIAYRTDFLYLILVGRCFTGISFSGFMYCKRYCTDPLIVGIRRRTTLCSWLVIGQAVGMTLGPFLGGILYEVGFQSAIFNGYTSPGWILACCHMAFWVIIAHYFEDVQNTDVDLELHEVAAPAPSTEGENQIGDPALLPPAPTPRPHPPLEESLTAHLSHITRPQWGVIICMCWFSMLCFFILASWEANLPVFGAATATLSWSPFSAGNFIALGGLAAFPFFLANMIFARHIQDRHLLAFGTGLGLCGLLVFISLLAIRNVVYGSLFACWWPIALGFNLATTVTLSLLSKQLPSEWNGRASLAIQYSNYLGRTAGFMWGGSGVAVGMENFVGLEIGLVGIGGVLFATLWRNLKAKTG